MHCIMDWTYKNSVRKDSAIHELQTTRQTDGRTDGHDAVAIPRFLLYVHHTIKTLKRFHKKNNYKGCESQRRNIIANIHKQ